MGGGCSRRGGGNWGTLRIPRDWGTTKSCFFDGNMFLGEFFVVVLCWKMCCCFLLFWDIILGLWLPIPNLHTLSWKLKNDGFKTATPTQKTPFQGENPDHFPSVTK